MQVITKEKKYTFIGTGMSTLKQFVLWKYSQQKNRYVWGSL